MASPAALNALLDKTSDWDKDERYMATSDLCAELQKDIKIDATMERRCVPPPARPPTQPRARDFALLRTLAAHSLASAHRRADRRCSG